MNHLVIVAFGAVAAPETLGNWLSKNQLCIPDTDISIFSTKTLAAR
jgi:hypothetical protein